MLSQRLSIHRRGLVRCAAAALALLATPLPLQAQSDPLPSWNDGATKQAITAFVEAVTTEGGADYVAPADRIATFDNDGTLWTVAPDVHPARLRAGPGQGTGARPPRMAGRRSPSRRCSTAT